MNENKIHIAVIGAGTVARDNQIPAFLKCSEAEVTAVFDRHIERAEALAGSYGYPRRAVGSKMCLRIRISTA